MLSNEDINKVLRYCLGHCDSDKETEVVEWVGKHLADQDRRNKAENDREVRL